MTGDLPFHLKLPVEGPMSFEGRLFSVDWLLRAEIGEGRDSEIVEIPFRVVAAPVSVAFEPPSAKRVGSTSWWMLVPIGFIAAMVLMRVCSR